MFFYEKKLQFPVKIATPNPKLAAFIISQYGGPDGELGASMRYLSQRYTMPYAEAKGVLTDIGVEELGHMEMVAAVVHQLTRNLTEEQIKGTPFAPFRKIFSFSAPLFHRSVPPCGTKRQVDSKLNYICSPRKCQSFFPKFLLYFTWGFSVENGGGAGALLPRPTRAVYPVFALAGRTSQNSSR